MSGKSDTPRTDERCAAIMAWQAKESDWPDFARQLERELAAVTEERDNAQIAAKIEAQDSDNWRERATKAEVECERLREALESLRSRHYECEDRWYSCPESEDGCADDRQGDECNCGANRRNEIIDAALARNP